MSAKGTSPRFWTQEETAYLREAYNKGIAVLKIAKRLKRSPHCIYSRARYLFLDRDWEPSNKSQWPARDINFIKNNFHKLTNVQLAKHLGEKLTVVRNKCRELGLLHMQLEYWTPDQVEYLKANFRQKGDQELAAEFQAKWPKKKLWTKKHLEKKRLYLNLKRTLEEQFLIRTGRFNADDYKDFNGKNFKIGKKRLWFSNGKYRWMIKTGRNFTDYARYKYNKLRGPIPRGKKIHFIDWDTTNTRITNLTCLTQSQIARRVGTKNAATLSDSYIAGLLSRRNPEMKVHIMNHPGILDAKRQQILYNRSKCKSINSKAKSKINRYEKRSR